MENRTIISRLSHIESTAVRILESADSRKKELALEMEQKTREFDEKLAKDTQKQLDTLREKLNAKKEADLSRLREETSRDFEILELHYEKNHTVWAAEILQAITGE